MKPEDFHILLRLEPKWGIGKGFPDTWPWRGLHFHDYNEPIGYNIGNGVNQRCGTCGALFSEKVIGIMNMMNGLS